MNLGQRITQIPEFKWKHGMAARTKSDLPFIVTCPNLIDKHPPWVGASLDLDHNVNTGFLMDILWSIHDDAFLAADRVGYESDEDELYTEWRGDDEHINCAIVRAILTVSTGA